MFKIEFEETGPLWTAKISKAGKMVGTITIYKSEIGTEPIIAALGALIETANKE